MGDRPAPECRTGPPRAGTQPLPGAEVDRLLHELQVHQIELQVQNEELLTARGKLEDAAARYAELFEFAPIGYATVTPDGAIRAINLAGARLLGQERSRLVSRRFAALLTTACRPAFSDLVAKSLGRATPSSCEVDRLDASVSLRCWGTALPSADQLVLLAFQDITEEKQQQKQLRRAHDSLRDASRRKDEFLAVLSHELRNPLAPIHNCLYLLERAEPGSDRAKNAQTILERQIKHLTRLVDDLLDVSRVSRGKITLQRERLELGDLVRKSLEDHRASFDARGIALESRVDPGPLTMQGDPERLVQALSNLLGNAQKFTSPGGTVTVTARRIDGHAELAVKDNGVGIARDMIDHLFEPFVQGPQSIDRARGGLGLGLAMVKGLIELHGGSVAIASPGLGFGTTITLTLPLDPAPIARPFRDAAGRRRPVMPADEGPTGVADLCRLPPGLPERAVAEPDT